MEHDINLIRNFSIIAHIDHGKSTLSDRLLEITNTVSKREMKKQFLDEMELEREKGITIKAKPVTMIYKSDNKNYQMNFIDTPGHVDFSYEVSRSLSACEGALLIVDATQGIQAQTLSNLFLAIEKNLEIIPVINKIDLPAANPEKIKKEIEEIIGLDTSNTVFTSAKTGEGIKEVLDKIIKIIPAPKIQTDKLKALIFDSHYETYTGAMAYIRVFGGKIEKKDIIKMMHTNKEYEVLDVGIFSPNKKPKKALFPGEVGYFSANIKNIKDIKIGDTITHKKNPAKTAILGFKKIQPKVFAGIYPIDTIDFENLKDAIYKLQLNDSALSVEQESSHALGLGFRCGFLGLLHLEIICERIKREFSIDIITTSPSVKYNVHLKNKEIKKIDSAAHFPDPSFIDFIEEPFVKCHIMTPAEFLGNIMSLAKEKRGNLIKTEATSTSILTLTYIFPLNEIITDFNDRIKSITKGYGSFDYEDDEYKKSDIIKLEIRLNEKPVDAFSRLVHRSKAEHIGRIICKKLKEIVPKQLFKVPIQAAIGGKIIARETLNALAKNVTAKCYGGDITRKRKLWEKQKKGKKKMKEIGKVKIPSSVFIDILKE